MTKADIVNEISKNTGIEKVTVQKTVEAFMETIKTSLAKNKNVSFNTSLKHATSQLTDFVLLKSGAQTHQILLADILYIEKDGNYLCVHTTEKKILVREIQPNSL